MFAVPQNIANRYNAGFKSQKAGNIKTRRLFLYRRYKRHKKFFDGSVFNAFMYKTVCFNNLNAAFMIWVAYNLYEYRFTPDLLEQLSFNC